MQGALHLGAECFISAGHHGGGQCMFCHFTGQVGAGQHADSGLRGDLFKDFAHQFKTVGFDALGQADQHFAAQPLGVGRQHAAQRAGRQRHKAQLAALQRGLQVGDRLDTRVNFDAFEVARVFSIEAHRLGLLGVAHPLVHTMTVFCQQVGHGGAKTTASQDRNSVLFSHMQSRLPSSSGNARIIRAASPATSPIAHRSGTVALKRTLPIVMNA